MARRYASTWLAVRAARKARRAADPAVQDRARQHAAREGQQPRRAHWSTLAAAADDRERAS